MKDNETKVSGSTKVMQYIFVGVCVLVLTLGVANITMSSDSGKTTKKTSTHSSESMF